MEYGLTTEYSINPAAGPSKADSATSTADYRVYSGWAHMVTLARTLCIYGILLDTSF